MLPGAPLAIVVQEYLMTKASTKGRVLTISSYLKSEKVLKLPLAPPVATRWMVENAGTKTYPTVHDF